MELTTVDNALDKIVNQAQDFGVEKIDFINSLGRILKEDIVADRDFPPFNRVSMDGIAILADTFNSGQRSFKIEGVQAAGSPQSTLNNKANCLEAMTGAVLPKNTDAVIPYEMLSIKDGFAIVNSTIVKKFQNVHLKGLDRKQGEVLISKNTCISPAEIGVLATVGKSEVLVAKQPKVMIISTGNELVEVSKTPEEHQIRRSNVFTLVSLLEKLHIKADTAHIIDDKSHLKTKIASYLQHYDVLLFSGAVSKGKYDFIPEVLDSLGVKKLFHKVKQRPGKPFWFGIKETDSNSNKRNSNNVVFAFPGNPVSTFVNCLKYFYPWYCKSVGVDFENRKMAALSEDFYFKPELTYFLQVKISNENGNLIATPVAGKGSGDLANLVEADAFLELPADRSNFTKGEVFPILSYRSY